MFRVKELRVKKFVMLVLIRILLLFCHEKRANIKTRMIRIPCKYISFYFVII